MQASQPPANKSMMAPTIKIVQRQFQGQLRMVQQQIVDPPAVETPQLQTRMATKTFGTHREVMAQLIRHLFVHLPALQIPASVATLMRRVEVQSAEPAPQQPVVHGTLNVQSAHQRHNQLHQQVYIRTTRSTHGWLLQVSDLFTSSSFLLCVLKMRVDAVYCCYCCAEIVYMKVNMEKKSA